MDLSNLASQIASVRGETRRRPGQVARVLAEAIEDGILVPGGAFPTDEELSHQFGLSRSAIREAVSCLKYDGLIQSRPGIGAVVSDNPAAQVIRMNPGAQMGVREMRELFDFRMQLEASSSELAALNRTTYDLEVIEASLDRMASEIEQNGLGLGPDMEFHVAVASATRNPYFKKFLESVCANLQDAIRARREMDESIYAQIDRILSEHRAIYQAIKEGDPVAAREAAFLHQRNSIISLKLKPGKILPPK